MISDFVNSMWSLAQFHTVNIIIPQTPFTKGEFKVTPQQRLWGIEKLMNLPAAETAGYLGKTTPLSNLEQF